MKGDLIDQLVSDFYTEARAATWTEEEWKAMAEGVVRNALQRQVDRDRVQLRAVLEGIYEDARSAITAPVHHALMGAARRLERLLGIKPGTPDFQLTGGGK